MTYNFEAIRYSKEKKIYPSVDPRIYMDCGIDYVYEDYLSDSEKAGPKNHPELVKICSEVKETLGFRKAVDIYTFNPESYFCENIISIPTENNKYRIFIRNDVLKELTEQELKFLIGDKIGNYIYGLILFEEMINDVRWEGDDIYLSQNGKRVKLRRYSVISCDRIGFLVMSDLKIAGSAIEKSLMDSNSACDAETRVKCLKLFSKSVLAPNKGKLSKDNLDKQVTEIVTASLEKPLTPEKERLLEFFSGSAIYLSNVNQDELNLDEDCELVTSEPLMSVMEIFTNYPG